MEWITFAILTSCFWSLYHMASKATSQLISPIVASVVSSLSLIIGSTLYYFSSLKISYQSLNLKGLVFAVLMGIGAGIGDIFYVYTYQKGGPISETAPITLIMLVILVLLISNLVFRESMTVYKMIGIVFGIISIYLVLR